MNGPGGFSPKLLKRRKMYRVGGEKREKGKKRGKIRQKIGKIRLKIGKRGENRRKASNLAKNMYKRLKIVSSYAKNRNHLELT